MQANYVLSKKSIRLVEDKNPAVLFRFPPPWREKVSSFSLESQDLIYMDQRLVIPKDMRENVLRTILFRNAFREAMLREASDVWWPTIHRKIVEKAEN